MKSKIKEIIQDTSCPGPCLELIQDPGSEEFIDFPVGTKIDGKTKTGKVIIDVNGKSYELDVWK